MILMTDDCTVPCLDNVVLLLTVVAAVALTEP